MCAETEVPLIRLSFHGPLALPCPDAGDTKRPWLNDGDLLAGLRLEFTAIARKKSLAVSCYDAATEE